jgi:hypothetical protein
MTQFTAENFRVIVDKLNEYMFAVTEDDSVPSNVSQPVSTLLTKPADIKKISGSLDVDALISMLEIPNDMQSNFKSALTALQEDNPTLSPGQALALATAFDHLLSSSSIQKAQTLGKIKTVGAANVSETKEDTSKHVTIDDVIKCVQGASEASPVAKLQTTKLVTYLGNGIKNRNVDGGMRHVMTGVVDAINAAQSGKETDALKHISSMVNHVEGDKHAFDSEIFPNLIVSLMLLVGDILQHAAK